MLVSSQICFSKSFQKGPNGEYEGAFTVCFRSSNIHNNSSGSLGVINLGDIKGFFFNQLEDRTRPEKRNSIYRKLVLLRNEKTISKEK